MLTLGDGAGEEWKAIWWGGGIEPIPEWLVKGAKLDLAYTARSRNYRGNREVQIEWLDAHPAEGGEIEVLQEEDEIAIIDHRDASHPLAELKLLLENEDAIVWAEAQARGKLKEQGINPLDRLMLEENKSLVI